VNRWRRTDAGLNKSRAFAAPARQTCGGRIRRRRAASSAGGRGERGGSTHLGHLDVVEVLVSWFLHESTNADACLYPPSPPSSEALTAVVAGSGLERYSESIRVRSCERLASRSLRALRAGVKWIPRTLGSLSS